MNIPRSSRDTGVFLSAFCFFPFLSRKTKPRIGPASAFFFFIGGSYIDARYPSEFYFYRGRGFCLIFDTRYPSAFYSYRGRVGRMEKGLRSRPFFTLPSPPVQLACFLQNGSVIWVFLLHYGHLQRYEVLARLSFSPMGDYGTALVQICVRTLPLIPDTTTAIPGWSANRAQKERVSGI